MGVDEVNFFIYQCKVFLRNNVCKSSEKHFPGNGKKILRPAQRGMTIERSETPMLRKKSIGRKERKGKEEGKGEKTPGAPEGGTPEGRGWGAGRFFTLSFFLFLSFFPSYTFFDAVYIC